MKSESSGCLLRVHATEGWDPKNHRKITVFVGRCMAHGFSTRRRSRESRDKALAEHVEKEG